MRETLQDGKPKNHRKQTWLFAAGLCLVFFLVFSSFVQNVGAQTSDQAHWEKLGRNRIALWHFSPNFATDNTMFLATSPVEKLSLRGVYQSTDRGTTWAAASEGLDPKKRHYYTTLISSPNFTQDQTLWLFGNKAALETNEPFGGFWESTDAGATWHEILMKGFPYRELTTRVSQNVLGAVVSPHIAQDGLMLAAAGGEGIFVSQDKGRNWVALDAVTDVSGIYAPPTFPDENFLVLATSGSQVMVSTDGGKTFETRSSGIPPDMLTIHGVAFSANFATDRKMFCFGSGGVYESDDAAQTWKTLAVPDTSVSFTAMDVIGDFSEFGAIVYGTDDNKTYLSDDMGKTFQSIGSETVMNYRLDTLAFAPDYQQTHQLFASSQDGIYRYGPGLNLAAVETSQANVVGVEGTRQARSTAASEFVFVPSQSGRQETGCITYMIAPLSIVLACGLRMKGHSRNQGRSDGN